MAYDPNRVHSDVASCLDEIARAVKGEEVRGSIYDAIELIDARSVSFIDEVRGNVSQMVDTKLDDIVAIFTVETATGGSFTCNLSGGQLMDIRDDDHGWTLCVIKRLNNSVSTIYPCQLGGNSQLVTINGSMYNADTKRMGYFSATITGRSSHTGTCTWESRGIQTKLTPGNNITIDETDPEHPVINSTGGGGGSYTEGDGIDINNDEISVKLRSSNPGLAFDSNGNLYATGSGGSYSGYECISVYNNVISLLYGYGLTVEYDSLNDIYELVPDYTYVQQKLDPGYGLDIRPGTGASTNPVISILPGVFMPYYDINQGSGLVIVANANSSSSLEVDFTTVQQKLTAGTGISIQNGVISLDLPQAEGGGF